MVLVGDGNGGGGEKTREQLQDDLIAKYGIEPSESDIVLYGSKL